ncbi:MAG: hypothetical protein JF595_04030 [Sphingomonadales bacterium]|nr:hypothetical protein [Sphingomonadales bacterium]
MRRATFPGLTAALALSLALPLAACGGDDPTPTATPTPTPTPSPTATATAASYDVENCFTQAIPGTGGLTLRSLIIPDTLKLDLTRPSTFPNGRTLTDPVIDVTLAALFLDFSVTGQSPATFAQLPLNPPANDRPFSSDFPFLAPPQGSPTLALTTGTSFNFRTDPDSAYVQVDRMGMPAVATALIRSPLKTAYNDANPTVDASGQYKDEEAADLKELFNGLGDDLTALGLKLCARTS